MVDWKALIDDYNLHHRSKFDREITWFKSKPGIANAISDAVASRDEDGRWYDHQRRIGSHIYAEAAKLLLSAAGQIQSATSFKRLVDIVNSAIGRMDGVGPLFIYDISIRIGAYLGLEPDEVYLHSGTRDGARRFGFASAKDKTLPLSVFPQELQKLGASQLENFLCIYAKAGF